MNYQGFLFDLDGTLVDSLPAVERAWGNWAEAYGAPVKDVLAFIHGKQAITSLRHFMSGCSESAVQAEFIALEKIESHDTVGVQALPGAITLLNKLIDLNIPWAIVTSGTAKVARARLKAADLPEPPIFITAESVLKGKPEPEPYLLGAQKIGLTASACVVVEDAPAGIISGLRAGCGVIAVNAPSDSLRLNEVLLEIQSLELLNVTKLADGWINVSTMVV